jgi:hypothetical protein
MMISAPAAMRTALADSFAFLAEFDRCSEASQTTGSEEAKPPRATKLFQ